MNTKVKLLLDKPQIEQRTPEWYEKRYNMLTASAIAPILDANPYCSKTELLKQKCQPFSLNEKPLNNATSWGIKYEPVAIKLFEDKVKTEVLEVGLLEHPKYPWLGASPDGILIDSGKLLEIKCVYNRPITKNVPLYYWIQIQIQLEVCDIENCFLYQCKFVEYQNQHESFTDYLTPESEKGVIYNDDMTTTYWKLENSSINLIRRDREWFQKIVPILKNFWRDVLYYREYGLEKLDKNVSNYDNVQINMRISRKRKRSYSDENIQTSENDFYKEHVQRKKRKFIDEDWSQWINCSDIKNYISNDPLLDWLNMYHERVDTHKYQPDCNNDFNEFLNNQEHEFKNYIFNLLQHKYPEDTIEIAHVNEKYSIMRYKQTINEMMRGRPFIIHPILHNRTTRVFCIPDLLIRQDYLKHLIKDHIYIQDGVHVESNVGHHYRLINIKYLTLTLKNDCIINTCNVSSYKAELMLGNQCLRPILGYVPNECFLIGSRYKCDNRIYDSLDKIGMIDSSGYDNKILEKTYLAVNWLKELKQYGSKWDIENPCRWELHPNMCNQFDYPWHQVKKNLALKNNEITLMWNCGIKERKLCELHGVNNWKDMTVDMIGFGKKRKFVLESILTVNSDDYGDKIFHNIGKKISKKKVEFFVDFETVNVINYNKFKSLNQQFDHGNTRRSKRNNRKDDGMIYMIGLGYVINGKWNFKTFLANQLNYGEEKRILQEWIKFMNNIKNKYNIKKVKTFHWSNAEVNISNKAFKRHNIKNVEICWYDLLNYFKENCISIKGVFNYGLKNVARGLYDLGFIKTKWEDSSLDGKSAILAAWRCNEYGKENGKKMGEYVEMKEIVKYNEIDCKVLFDILNFTRKL